MVVEFFSAEVCLFVFQNCPESCYVVEGRSRWAGSFITSLFLWWDEFSTFTTTFLPCFFPACWQVNTRVWEKTRQGNGWNSVKWNVFRLNIFYRFSACLCKVLENIDKFKMFFINQLAVPNCLFFFVTTLKRQSCLVFRAFKFRDMIPILCCFAVLIYAFIQVTSLCLLPPLFCHVCL